MTEYGKRFYSKGDISFRGKYGLTPEECFQLLLGIWCAETCAPRMRDRWTANDPTLGQCSVTAFLMQDIFGGHVLGVPLEDGNYHCFNVVGESVFDLTSEQFGDKELDYSDCPEQLREVHFAKAEKKDRYEKLAELLRKAVSKASK